MSNEPQLNAGQESGNPERRGIKKGLYLIPSAFTAANISMGFFAVMAALRGFQLVDEGSAADLQRAAEHFDNAAKAICWAVLFDMLDGRIARMTKTTTEIGVQFDSIADVLTFGIAPAVLAYAWGYGSALAEGGWAHKLGWFLSFMYLMCGAFRLARFNVQAARPRILAEGVAKVDKKNFIGLPIPPAAALIAAIIHFSPMPLIQYEPRYSHLYSGLMMTLVGLLVANDVNLFGGSTDGRVYAVRKKTGDISWIMQHSAPFTSHPVIFGSNLYIGSNDGTVFSLDQNTGRINWRYRTRGAIRGRAVAANGLVYFGSADGYVYAVREADGRLRWRRRTGAGVQTVAFAQNGLLVASLDNFVYLLSFSKGDRLWKRQLAGRIAAEPLTTPDGVLFTPLSSSTGVVLDLRDGKQLNSLPIGEDNSMSASPIVAGKVLFVTTRHGLLAFSRPG